MSLVNLDQHIRELDIAALTSIEAPADSAETKANRRHLRRVTRKRFARIEQRAAAIDHLRPLPGPGETLHLALDGSFAAWHLFSAIVELLGAPVEHFTCATLGYSRENASDLLEMLDDGRVRRATLIVSDYFKSSDRLIFQDIKRELEARGQSVCIARCHAKMLLVESGEHNIVCEMSANLRSSQNWEQVSVCDDRALLHFHKQWLSDLLSKEK